MKRFQLGVIAVLAIAGVLFVTGIPRVARKQRPGLKAYRPSSELIEQAFRGVHAQAPQPAPIPLSPGFQEPQTETAFLRPTPSPTPTPCRSPCPSVNLTCNSGPCGSGSNGCMDTGNCDMNLSSSVCDDLELENGTIVGTPECPPSDTVEEAVACCTMKHEFDHAGQDTCDTSDCVSEESAYGASADCYQDSANDACDEQVDSDLCENLRFLECANESVQNLQICRALDSGNCDCSGCEGACESTMNACMESHGLSIDTAATMCESLNCWLCDPQPPGCE